MARPRDDARPLTSGEIAMLAPLFGDAIDYRNVSVRRRAWWPLQPRNVVMAPDGDIWCHPAGGVWRADFAAASLPLQTLFVHEMTHVWQAQRGGRWFLPLARHPFCRYRYRLVPGRPFAGYGLEQQAEIVAHAFLARQGATAPYPAEAYDALLNGAFRRPP
jgi:hypothetical protein